VAKKKKTEERTEKAAIRALKKEVKDVKKDIKYIKHILENPANAMMVMSGQAKPGEKVTTSCGLGIHYARMMKDQGRTDELRELGMEDEEIDRLEEDFEPGFGEDKKE
jgi:hypothetical protein